MASVIHESRRVLVADDDESIRRLLGTLVERENLPVDSASDGAEAIEMLERHEYSVILLDLMMPRVDGFAVIDYIRDHPREGKKPIVLVITAYADQNFKDVDSDVVSGVLRKPFDVSEIGALIRLCVSGSEPDLRKLFVSEDAGVRQLTVRLGDSKTTPDRGN